MGTSMEIALPAEVHNVALAREAVKEFMDQNGMTEDESFSTLAACGEAIINVCEHAYKGFQYKGKLIVRGYIDGTSLYLEVEDDGVWNQECVLSDDPFADRGRGIKMMNMLTDSVTFWCKIDGGSIVRLVTSLQSLSLFASAQHDSSTVAVA